MGERHIRIRGRWWIGWNWHGWDWWFHTWRPAWYFGKVRFFTVRIGPFRLYAGDREDWREWMARWEAMRRKEQTSV